MTSPFVSCQPADTAAPLAWLAIGIPTVPRHNDTDYLTATLGYLFSELPSDSTDPLFDKVRVIVMNNKPGQHPVYDKVQNRVAQGMHEPDDVFAHKAAQYVEFVDNPGSVEDPTPDDKPEPNDFDNPTNIPGRFEPFAAYAITACSADPTCKHQLTCVAAA